MKDWEQIEVAVERFVAALDPRVKVRRNVKLSDRDTGANFASAMSGSRQKCANYSQSRT